MALYPREDNEQHIAPEQLTSSVAAIFRACGMFETDARTVAGSLVHAGLRGIHSHGVLRVPDYVKKMTVEGVDPKGQPRVVSETGGAICIDGANSMGQAGGKFERARETGVAFAAVGGSNHCGAMDYYTLPAAENNMVGLAGTNTLPTMAPWGGVDKIVGLNPLSVALPGDTVPPIVMDFALGATAHGKIRVFAKKGEPIPEGWAFDVQGRPTTDAQAALYGLFQPLGALKGIGLAMIIGLLSTLFTDAGYGTESGNMVDGAISGVDGQFFMAINIAAFTEVKAFKERVDKIVAQFNNSWLAPDFEEVFVPGALEKRIAERNFTDGIPLNAEMLEGISMSASRLGVGINLRCKGETT